MYSPNYYKENREEFVLGLIHEFPFAVMLTMNGEQVSHLPLILEKSGNQTHLLGHMAKANPHWRELSEKSLCKAIFQGPHGYISPAWYLPEEDNVPTWNYAVVHVVGRFEIISEPSQAFDVMDRMVTEFELKYKTGWQLPKNEKAIDDLMKAIVVFRLNDLKFEAKFKLSQREILPNRQNVIAQLRQSEDQILNKLAEKMTLISKDAKNGSN